MRFALVVAATTILCGVDPALACRCTPPQPPLLELAASDAVFSGSVTSVELDETGLVPYWRVKVSVDQCWKGDVGINAVIQTPISSAACGREFEVEVKYLIYAVGESLRTISCDRTRPLEFAQEDLDALGSPSCTTPVLPSSWGMLKRLYE